MAQKYRQMQKENQDITKIHNTNKLTIIHIYANQNTKWLKKLLKYIYIPFFPFSDKIYKLTRLSTKLGQFR